MNLLRRIAGVIVAASILASCSATKLAYNNLDWVVSWRIDDYIDMHGPAKVLFEQRFAAIWKWHRKTQLPLYSADLRELSKAVAEPLSVEQCARYLERAQSHADNIVAKALPDWIEVLASLSDEQVEGFLKNLRRRQRETAEEIAEGEYWDRREKRLENMHDGIKRWLGSITPEQEKRASEWADQLKYDPDLRFRLRKESTAEFQNLMRARAEPGFNVGLTQMVNDPQLPSSADASALYEHNRQAGLAMISDLTRLMTSKQREHLQERIEDLAKDLQELSAQPAD